MSQRNRNSQRDNISSLNITNSATQLPQNSLDQFEDLVQKCVRLFLIKSKTNSLITRPQIIQIFQDTRRNKIDNVIKQADELLQRLYGLKIITVDHAAQKKYVLVNNLAKPEIIDNSEEDFKQMILFLVLTHIFMSRNCATDVSLWEFLNELNITPDKEISCSETVQSYITKQLVKEQYIQIDNLKTNDESETRKQYSWGIKVENSVSKMKILEFVAKMYGNSDVKSWISRYEIAEKQFENSESE